MGRFTYDSSQLLNATCNYVSGEKLDGNKDLKITANEGYSFDRSKTYTLTDGSNTYRIAVSRDGSNMEWYTSFQNLDKDYTINGVIEAKSKEDTNAKHIYIKSLVNCTCNYKNGETLSLSKPIIITANDGYEYDSDFDYEGGQDVFVARFKRSKDNKTLTASFTAINYDVSIGIITANQVTEQINTFVNLYQISDTDLNLLSKETFATQTNTISATEFIYSLYKFPLEINSDMLGDLQKLQFGIYDTKNAKGTVIKSSKIVYDLGDITVKEEYKNVYDYLNTECILHLPLFENINLSTEYVIGQTIHIKYIIDMYEGRCYIELSSSFNQNNVFYHGSMKIVQDMPYSNDYKNDKVNSLSTMYLNNIEKPFIEIKRNIPYFSSDKTFGNESVETNVLKDKKGFISIDDIILETSATNNETENIIKLLKEGVIIL